MRMTQIQDGAKLFALATLEDGSEEFKTWMMDAIECHIKRNPLPPKPDSLRAKSISNVENGSYSKQQNDTNKKNSTARYARAAKKFCRDIGQERNPKRSKYSNEPDCRINIKGKDFPQSVVVHARWHEKHPGLIVDVDSLADEAADIFVLLTTYEDFDDGEYVGWEWANKVRDIESIDLHGDGKMKYVWDEDLKPIETLFDMRVREKTSG